MDKQKKKIFQLLMWQKEVDQKIKLRGRKIHASPLKKFSYFTIFYINEADYLSFTGKKKIFFFLSFIHVFYLLTYFSHNFAYLSFFYYLPYLFFT
jgi:hypothetical protein